MSGGATLCSAAGTTSLITFSGSTGALPSVDILTDHLVSNSGTPPIIYFETEQTITCTMAGVAGGSFALSLDGVTTGDIAFGASAATIQTELTGAYGRINTGAATNAAAVTFDVGAAPCGDTSTVVSTVKLRTTSGNLPTLGMISSLTDAALNVPSAITVGHASRGSKDSKVCNGIGTCDFDNGRCDCGDFYTFSDAYGGDCGRPVVNTSSWVGVETCPGVVYQSTKASVVKPSSYPRLYFAQASNRTNTGLHFYETGLETTISPQLIGNMSNVSTGAVALDLAEGFMYYVDNNPSKFNIERVAL